MGKKDNEKQKQPKNKGHKTLRAKLRKKRQTLKQHKKQKKLKHQQYDPQQKKRLFFQQKNKAMKQGQIRQKKVNKYIKKFINIYQDDLQDFYEIFSTFDKNGEIDISEIQNKSLQKCLKKMFKYLPLNKKKMVYRKKELAQTKLQPYMRNNVSGIIQDYLQNGTDSEKEAANQWQSSSIDQKIEEEKKQKTKKQKIEKLSKKDQEEQQIITFPKNNLNPLEQNNAMGPFISAQQRQKIALLFAKQLEQQQKQAKQKEAEQENQFNRIFDMSSQRKKKGNTNIDQAVPEHLLAQGSAQIGQKVQIDQDYMQQYDKIHRPKKLIDMHKQMMNIGKQDQDQNKKERKPFDRQRDIVNGRFRQRQQMMNNSVFFDFKDKMTKPKGTNNFL